MNLTKTVLETGPYLRISRLGSVLQLPYKYQCINLRSRLVVRKAVVSIRRRITVY